MKPLSEIESLSKTVSEARGKLTFLATALQDDYARCKRAKLPGIKEALAVAVNAQNALQAAVAESPGLFEKPRTFIFHGIKVGFAKQKGKLTWADDAKVVKLIREHLSEERAGALIRVTEAPIRDALSELDGKLLKRLGITVEADGDKVIVKPVDAEIDKLVSALMDAALDKPEAADSTAK
jgi:hypothetical protein